MITSTNRRAHLSFDANKRFKAVVFVSVFSALAYFGYSALSVKQPLTRTVMEDSAAKNFIDSHEKPAEQKSDSLAPVFASSPLDSVTPADARDNIHWHADKGYFTEDDLSAYQSYSDDDLNNLIKSGDVRAMDLQARRLVDKKMSEAAKVLYWMAAVHGSTASLKSIALLSEPDYKLGETVEEHNVVFRQSVIESLALMQTASLRGDIRNAAQGIKSLKQLYEYQAKAQLVLSPDENLYIESRGQEIYEQLQRQRRELGLGEFDNSTSKVEQLLYEFFINFDQK